MQPSQAMVMYHRLRSVASSIVSARKAGTELAAYSTQTYSMPVILANRGLGGDAPRSGHKPPEYTAFSRVASAHKISVAPLSVSAFTTVASHGWNKAVAIITEYCGIKSGHLAGRPRYYFFSVLPMLVRRVITPKARRHMLG